MFFRLYLQRKKFFFWILFFSIMFFFLFDTRTVLLIAWMGSRTLLSSSSSASASGCSAFCCDSSCCLRDFNQQSFENPKPSSLVSRFFTHFSSNNTDIWMLLKQICLQFSVLFYYISLSLYKNIYNIVGR